MNFARTAAVACLSLCLSHAAFAEDAGKPPSSPDTASLAFDANEPEGTPMCGRYTLKTDASVLQQERCGQGGIPQSQDNTRPERPRNGVLE